MASANARPLAPAETSPQPSADWMLEQLAALLDRATETTPTMMRVRIRAIYEGIEVPDERKAFIVPEVEVGDLVLCNAERDSSVVKESLDDGSGRVIVHAESILLKWRE